MIRRCRRQNEPLMLSFKWKIEVSCNFLNRKAIASGESLNVFVMCQENSLGILVYCVLEEQANCKYCWSKACPLLAPTNFKFISQIWCQYHARRQRKVWKTKFKQKSVWCAIRSNAIKVKLDLYYVKTNSYTKMSSQLLQHRRRKSGKRNFWKG